MTDCATKRTWLLEAELALHKLSTGQQEVTVTFGSGKSVTYNATSLDKLKTYINDLRAQVDECDGKTPCNKRRPIRFTF